MLFTCKSCSKDLKKDKCRNGIHEDQKNRMLCFVTKNHIVPLNEFLSCVAKKREN